MTPPDPSDRVLLAVVDGVAVVTLNRPAALNAVDTEMRGQLGEALREADADPAVRAIVLTGTGRAFCVGHDVKERRRDDGRDSADDFFMLPRALRTPSVAAINGVCVAGGASLALGCDLRVAAPEAAIGWTQPQLGLMAVSGPCVAARILPRAIAMRYLLTGDLMDAAVAARWGLVDDVVPSVSLLETALALGRRIASCAPLAVSAVRATVHEADLLTLDAQLVRAKERAAQLAGTVDAQEGAAAFLAKRVPRWSGR